MLNEVYSEPQIKYAQLKVTLRDFMYIPLDMLEAVVTSAVGGVAVEVGSSDVGGVAVEVGSSAVGGVAVEVGSSADGVWLLRLSPQLLSL